MSRVLPGLLVAIVAAVYAAGVGNGFVYDDHEVILAQEPLRSGRDALRVFAEPHGLPLSQLPYYRAVTRLSLLVQKTWHGDVAGPFHLANAALATLAALGAYAVLRARGFALPAAAAALAAAVWALHPLTSSAVWPIASGRETLMPTVFSLWAVAAHLRGGLAGRAGSAALLALALLSKEQALTLPAVLLAADAFALTADPPGRRLGAWALRAAPLLVVVLGYGLLRRAVVPGEPGGSLLAAVAESLGREPLGPLLSLLYALQGVFAPFAGVVYEPEVGAWLSPLRLLLALAASGLLIAAARRLPAADRRAAGFWLLWVLLCMATTLNLVRLEIRFAERFVVLPAFGLVALGATVVTRACVDRGRERLGLAAGLAAIALLGGLTLSRMPTYRDDLRFSAQWVRTSPAHANARFVLGTALLERGRVGEALGELRTALAIDPAHPGARFNLAVGLVRQGRRAEAATELERLLGTEGRSAEAREALERLRAPPRDPRAP